MTLYILKYNNYYNRLVKSESTLDEYKQYLIYPQTEIGIIQAVNFNPNDGVDTQHVIGVGEYDGSGDYLIALDEDGEIVSRWFIIDTIRTRAGLYQVQLRRDLIVDYYNVIKLSPMFIEKATLGDDDPLIYNTENMTFNLIKLSETLLKDETNSAWIVGYMSSKPNVDGLGVEQNIVSKIQYHLPVDEEYASKENYIYYNYSNLSLDRKSLISNPTNKKVCIYFNVKPNVAVAEGVKFAFNANGNQNTGILGATGYSTQFPYTWLDGNDDGDEYYQAPDVGGQMIWGNSLKNEEGVSFNSISVLKYLKRGFASKYSNIFKLFDQLIDSFDAESILGENGKKIYFQDTGKYYIVKVEVQDSTWAEIRPAYNSALWLAMKEGYDATKEVYASDPLYSFEPTWADFTGVSADPNSYSFSLNFTATKYLLTLEEQPEPSLTYEILIDNKRWHLNDAPYDMFCMPYSDDLVINNGGSYFCTANKELAFLTALALGRDYMGAGYIYDIQLLPYCPIRECIKLDGTFDIQSANHYLIKSYTESLNYDTGTVVGTLLFGTRSNFTLNINSPIALDNKKIQSNCDLWRLCSPNYSGLFEFNVAKNDGVDFFNVDCTYKPYNPYIHLNPNFKNLYGYDANDMRGLVCGGDFSLANVTDSWRTYELNNKNYQNIFDRNIQSMELRNNIQDNKDVFNAITGTIFGGVAGAVTGAKGGVAGTIAGGVIGTGVSLAGGIADVSTNRTLRKDALDLTKDQFGYLLGNIQALPYSLAKTSAFTANNKIFPFVEYYSCTVTEKLALANKVSYNGMTVMRIGTMDEFIGNTWSYQDIVAKNYIKGQLIRFNDDGEDYHIVNSIADELYKGVYIE